MTKAEFERRRTAWRRRSVWTLSIPAGTLVMGAAWLYVPVAIGPRWPQWVELTWDAAIFGFVLLSISLYGRALKYAIRRAGLVCGVCGGLLPQGEDEGGAVMESGRCPTCGAVVISDLHAADPAPAT